MISKPDEARCLPALWFRISIATGNGMQPAGLHARRIGTRDSGGFSNVILRYAAFLPPVMAIAPEGASANAGALLRPTRGSGREEAVASSGPDRSSAPSGEA